MDFRQFAPFTSIFRRNRRVEEPPDQYAGQYHLADSPYSDHFFDNMAFNPRRDSPFRTRYNGVQDFHWPAVRTRGLPIDAYQTRVLGGYPLRVPFMDVDPTHPFHIREPERLPDGGRVIGVLDEKRPSSVGIEQRRRESSCNKDPLSLLDFIDYDHPEAQRWPETRRSTLYPGPYSSYRHGDPKPQERRLRSMARRMVTPGADGDRDRNPQIGAQKDSALPFRKAMQWLHEGLVDAESFYKKFYDDYDKEIRSIKYAGTGILEELWVKKVTGKAMAGQSGSQGKQPAEKWEDKFAEKQRCLREAMKAALNASLSLGDQESPKAITLEARKRLLEKVETAGHHVVDLLGMAMKGSEHCKALLDELKMLKDLVDPKKKENKSLYEGVDDGGAGGGQDHGGTHDGGDYNNVDTPAWE